MSETDGARVPRAPEVDAAGSRTRRGKKGYRSAWCSRPLGEPMCIIPTVPGSPPKGEIQSSECVVFTPLGGPMCITPTDSSQGHSYQGQPEAFPTIRCRLGGISFRGPHTAEVLLCDEMSTQEPCTHY